MQGLELFSSARFWPKDDNMMIGSIHIHTPSATAYVDPGGPHTISQGRIRSVDGVVENVDTLLRSGITGLEELTIQVGILD